MTGFDYGNDTVFGVRGLKTGLGQAYKGKRCPMGIKESLTAVKLLKPSEPFLIIRMVPTAVLKYAGAGTALSRPEDIIAVTSRLPLKGVAIREEIESTGVRLPLVGT